MESKEIIMDNVLKKQPLSVEIAGSEVLECMTIYAEQQSIAFAEWLAMQELHDYNGEWEITEGEWITSAQLYQMFLMQAQQLKEGK